MSLDTVGGRMGHVVNENRNTAVQFQIKHFEPHER